MLPPRLSVPPPVRLMPDKGVLSAIPALSVRDAPVRIVKPVFALRLAGAEMICEPEAIPTVGNTVPLLEKIRLPPLPGPIVS